MKLALLSDLHANARALEACLTHAQAQGANQWALLGDLVGYGPEPEAVVAQCQRMAEAGATVLRGNHDAMAVTPPVPASRQGEFTARWTHERLSEADRQWLASLPLTVRLESVMVVHASVNEPEQWRYVEDEGSAARSLQAATDQYPEVRFVMGGHVHHQTLYYRGQGGQLMRFTPVPGVPIPVPAHRRWIATVGSVGQPRDGDTRAGYALLDLDRHQLTFWRVRYDHVAAAHAVRAAGLDEALARRLESGR
ncbi:MAG: metallophosphatase family protein [Betaproteobacteria bacterium]|jgi:diadenosine tetraphosphatase ApaH/serine/threonine PP2A family protein phosphatase|nr:metallophosphatase family protein [Betaproteobacteria bacterium]NBU44709.1 metallophosphatase family protein [Betaproteobacteria bacterium]NDF64344.1 metallophosphatase family protein [Betaproteobacteria bacterium]